MGGGLTPSLDNARVDMPTCSEARHRVMKTKRKEEVM